MDFDVSDDLTTFYALLSNTIKKFGLGDQEASYFVLKKEKGLITKSIYILQDLLDDKTLEFPNQFRLDEMYEKEALQ